MKLLTTLLVSSLILMCSCSTKKIGQDAKDNNEAFALLKTLHGNWQTTNEPMPGKGKQRVDYRVTSGGNILHETLFPGTDHEMVSVYQMDGSNLVLTHYCMLPNQPKLAAIRTTEKEVEFSLVGGTNLNPEKDSHMHQLKVTFKDNNHVRQEWSHYEGAKKGDATVFELVRIE